MKKLALIFTLLGTIEIQTAVADTSIAPRRVTSEIIQLVPEQNTDVKLDKVETQIFSDGSVTFNISGNYPLDGEPIAYELKYNIKRGTYSTHLVDRNLTIPLNSNEPIPALASGTGNNICSTGGLCSAQVRLQTRDPLYVVPFAVLARTTNKIVWQKNSNKTITLKSYIDNCWSNPNTGFPFYTIWKTTSCSSDTPSYSSGNTSIINIAKGKYYNFNWGNDAIATYASHSVTLQAYWSANTFYYNAIATHSGEDSALILPWILLN